ncbi:VOC family protein [Actinoplanes sp. NPDC051851]|uniref:VOC family protein n=1 Tax=Actinoplanes sp. NPDC051851 TaxID=3154753 RepID=UPI00344938B8
MANQAGRPIAPARKLVAAVMGTLAVFVIVFGLGMSSWPVAIFGLVVLAVAIALTMMKGIRPIGGKATIACTAEVLEIAPPPVGPAYGRAEIRAIVVVPGLGNSEQIIRDGRVPVAKWPVIGATIPVTVDVADTRRVRVNWKDAPLRDEQGDLPPPPPPEEDDEDETDDAVLGLVPEAPWTGREDDWTVDEPGPQPGYENPAGYDAAPVVVRETPDGTIVEGHVIGSEDDTAPLPRRARSTSHGDYPPPPPQASAPTSPAPPPAASPAPDAASPYPEPSPAATPPAPDPSWPTEATDPPPASRSPWASPEPPPTPTRPAPAPAPPAPAPAAPVSTPAAPTPESAAHAAPPPPPAAPSEPPRAFGYTPPSARNSPPASSGDRPPGSRPSPRPRGGTATATVEPVTVTATGMRPPAQRTSTESHTESHTEVDPLIDVPLDEPAPPPAPETPAAVMPVSPPAPRVSPESVPPPRRETRFIMQPGEPDDTPAVFPASAYPNPDPNPPSGPTPIPSTRPEPTATAVHAAPSPMTAPPTAPDPDRPFPTAPAPSGGTSPLVVPDPVDIPLDENPDTPPASRSGSPWGDFSGRNDPDDKTADIITAYPSARPGPAGAIHGVGITVLVTDLPRSIAFYRDTLGFYEIDTGADSAVLASGDTRLVLRTVHNLSSEAGRLIYLNLEVGDIEAVHEELRAKGVKFVHLPRPVNRGDKLELWSASFRDPDNHNIAITQWRAIP